MSKLLIQEFSLIELNPARYNPREILDEALKALDSAGDRFRWIAGYEGGYAVNRQGVVISMPQRGHRYRIIALKPRQHTCGYLRVNLSKDGCKIDQYIHRLVAEAFIDNPENLPQVNHKNGNKKDNLAENLEWCTDQYNLQHAFKIGLTTSKMFSDMSLVQSRGKRKLTFEQAQEVRRLYHSGEMRFSEICRMFGISDASICGILNNTTYKVA